MVGGKMKILFMGTPQFAVPILDMLVKKHEVVLVITQPDKPVGRKKILTPSPVKERALAWGLPVFQPNALKKQYTHLFDLDIDVMVTAAYGQMLPKELLEFRDAINVHGSLLPQYRGGAPIQYALFDGLKKTGVTVMSMVYQMDAGDIIKQEDVVIDDHDNYQSLSIKMSHVGAKLLDEVLDNIEKGVITFTPQDPSQVTFAYTLKPQDERIHFNQPTERIINRIRGLSPEPGATASIKNTTLKFYRAQKGDIIEENARPGTVLVAKKRFVIKTLDGSIEMLDVQAPGKRIMSAKDFLNGQTFFVEGDGFEEGSF
jgi:methionyl-tRNA formyltransferase